MITIDGSYGEAGGQMLRTALAMSTLTGKSFKMNNIRKGRCTPGLKAQHLTCIQALKKICHADAEHAALGSTEIIYQPGKIKNGHYEFNVGTAGSVTLVLQALLFPLMFVGKKNSITLTGGTCVKWSQPLHYFTEVVVPQLQRYCHIHCEILKRGYFPKGGGKVKVTLRPKFRLYDFDTFAEFLQHMKEQNISMNLTDQGNLMMIKGISHASAELQTRKVAERQANAAALVLSKKGCPVSIRTEYSHTLSVGSGITLWAVYSREKDDINTAQPIRIGADALGRKEKTAEEIGEEAARMLEQHMQAGAPVDEYLADNLIPGLMFGGNIRCNTLSNHTKTNTHVVEQFIGKTYIMNEEEKIISVP